jgi:hypothetical protein
MRSDIFVMRPLHRKIIVQNGCQVLDTFIGEPQLLRCSDATMKKSVTVMASGMNVQVSSKIIIWTLNADRESGRTHLRIKEHCGYNN